MSGYLRTAQMHEVNGVLTVCVTDCRQVERNLSSCSMLSTGLIDEDELRKCFQNLGLKVSSKEAKQLMTRFVFRCN